MLVFWNLGSAIPDKTVGTPSKFSPPLTFSVEFLIRRFFLFLLEKNAIFSTIEYGGDGGYVIQLKCPKYFWPGLWLI